MHWCRITVSFMNYMHASVYKSYIYFAKLQPAQCDDPTKPHCDVDFILIYHEALTYLFWHFYTSFSTNTLIASFAVPQIQVGLNLEVERDFCDETRVKSNFGLDQAIGASVKMSKIMSRAIRLRSVSLAGPSNQIMNITDSPWHLLTSSLWR